MNYLIVKIDAFVEVSASRLRNLQPISPNGSSIGKNLNTNKITKNVFFHI
jgi:hypothetical protein